MKLRYLHGWRRVGGGISQSNDQGKEHAALVDGAAGAYLKKKEQINGETEGNLKYMSWE